MRSGDRFHGSDGDGAAGLVLNSACSSSDVCCVKYRLDLMSCGPGTSWLKGTEGSKVNNNNFSEILGLLLFLFLFLFLFFL